MKAKKYLALLLACMLVVLAGCQTAPAAEQVPQAQEDGPAEFTTPLEQLLAAPRQALEELIPAALMQKYGETAQNIAIEKTTGEAPTYTVVFEYYTVEERASLSEALIEALEGEKADTAQWNFNSTIFKTKEGFVELSESEWNDRRIVRTTLQAELEPAAATRLDDLLGLAAPPALPETDGVKLLTNGLRYEGVTNLLCFTARYSGQAQAAQDYALEALDILMEPEQQFAVAPTPEGFVALSIYGKEKEAGFELALKRSCYLVYQEVQQSRLTYAFYTQPESLFKAALPPALADMLQTEVVAASCNLLRIDGQPAYSTSIAYANPEQDIDALQALAKEKLSVELAMEQPAVFSAVAPFGWVFVNISDLPDSVTLGLNRPADGQDESFLLLEHLPQGAYTALPEALITREVLDESVSYNKPLRSIRWAKRFSPMEADVYQKLANQLYNNLSQELTFTLTELDADGQIFVDAEEEAEATPPGDTPAEQAPAREFAEGGIVITRTNGSVVTTFQILRDDMGMYHCSLINALLI